MKFSHITKAFNSILIVDAVLCNVCMPYLGVNLSAFFAEEFQLSTEYELLLTVLFSYLFASIILLAHGRRTRWKPQFSAQQFQYCLIQVRDLLNVMISIFCLYCIGVIVQKIMEDEAIKSPPVGEGAGYVIIKLVLGQLNVDIDLLQAAKDLGLNYPKSEEPREIHIFEHGGEFMFCWALLASCVAKLTYFNSVFTIIRASEIFIDLNPKFNAEAENDTALQEQNNEEENAQEKNDQEQHDQEQNVQEQNVQKQNVQEQSVQEKSVLEQNDERDSDLSIQFQQDQTSGRSEI